MIDLVLQHQQLIVGELLFAVNFGGARGVLGHQGTLAEDGDVLSEAAVLGKGVDIAHQLVARDALERVADLGLEVAREVNGRLGGEALLDLLGANLLAICLTWGC